MYLLRGQLYRPIGLVMTWRDSGGGEGKGGYPEGEGGFSKGKGGFSEGKGGFSESTGGSLLSSGSLPIALEYSKSTSKM